MRRRSTVLLLRLALAVSVLVAARVVAGGLASRHRPEPGRVEATAVRADGPPADNPFRHGASAVVPPGMRAVRVTVEPEWRLPPGSVVDVLAPPEPPGFGEGNATGPARVVAAGAVVLPEPAAGRTDRAKRALSAPSVMLLVTLDAARQVASAAAVGPLALVLAPSENACCRPSSSVSSKG